MPSLRYFVCAVTLAILWPVAASRAELLADVPSDALGFVLAHDMAAIDAKIDQLSSMLRRNLLRPLKFLKDVAGVNEGVNVHGDFLLALFPDAGDGRLQFCVWVPVSDFDRFLQSIHATGTQMPAAATIAGEDLIVARHNGWALIMDPEQRSRLSDLAAGTNSPAALTNWKDWIHSNDITFVALSPGVHQLLDWLGNDNAEDSSNSPFSSNMQRQVVPGRPAAVASGGLIDMLRNARLQSEKWLAVAPELTQALQQVPAIACGMRLDSQGNASASFRAALDRDLASELMGTSSQRAQLPISSYGGGGFAIYGAGNISPSALATIAATYVRRTAADLRGEERTELNSDTLKRLEEAVEQAATGVRSIAFVNQPGLQPQPVYTNNFVTLRVESTKKFVERSSEVVRLWNKANRDAKGETHLVFDIEETKVADHPATQYSLDVAALDGGVTLPEVRQAMERLFGPGGKLRAWVVNVNDDTVLLATATPDQVTAAVKNLEKKQPIDWKMSEVAEPNALLPADSNWRMFIDFHHYVDWSHRELAAMHDVPVIGGRPAVEFPTAPAVGIAGGVRDSELWCDATVPIGTLTAAAQYIEKKQTVTRRGRTRIVAPAPVPK